MDDAVDGPRQPSEALKAGNGASQAVHEGYAGLFFTAVTGGKGLPLELFLAIMRLVRAHSETDLVHASHVCPAWRKAILECPDLWDELVEVELGFDNERVRLCTTASRAKGFLRKLGISFEADAFERDPASAALTLRDTFREISQRDGARRLQILSVDLRDLRVLGDPEVVLACLVQTVNFAELASVRLESLKLVTDTARFPAGAPFFAALPSLKKLLLVSRQYASADGRLPDFFSQVAPASSTPAYSSMLTRLTLQGVSLADSVLPQFPHLKDIQLCYVQCCNLLGLMTSCAKTLEALWLFAVEADPANRYLPPAQDAAGQKDVPGVLELPKLEELLLAGDQTPSFWTPPAPTTSHFVISTPRLKKIGLCWQYEFQYLDDDEGDLYVAAAKHLKAESLSTLFRKSPELQSLNLEKCTVTSQALMSALAFAPSSLTTLCIGGTAAAASDDLIERLHVLLPSLSWLDVFSPDGDDEPSLPALARLASRLRQKRSLSDWVGAFHLTIVAPAQVSHIPSQLLVNLPPNAPSFEQIQQEILALPEPPVKTPLSVNGLVDANGLGNGNGNGAAPQQPAPPRPAGTQQVFDDACALAQRWQRAREDELAVQFCRQAIGVELKWGVGCEDWDCDCRTTHPGYSEWHHKRGSRNGD
ncbi:hypothetical protein JCM10908_003341 [Rhodotorula pacifica]|uniref:uncharacterized protein n=1 Tax=Rhodotorula pacifica TaxID=1495444 RepID=UPI00316C90F3